MRTIEVTPENPGTIDINVGSLAGWWKLEAVRLDEFGNEVVRPLTDWFPNLITNGGLDRIARNSDYVAFCQVGTGSTTPANTDTTLASFVASVALGVNPPISTGNSGAPDYYIFAIWQYTFALGAVVGNMAEIGAGWSGSSGSLFTRALIVDGGGSPTTISVLADEQLRAQYQLRIYPNLTDVTGNITISAINYSYLIRGCNVGTYIGNQSGTASHGWGGFGRFTNGNTPMQVDASSANYPSLNSASTNTTSPLNANQGSPTSFTNAAYTNGTFVSDHVLTLDTTKWNIDIKTIVYQFFFGCYQIEFTPVLAKTNLKTLTLTLRQAWSRR